jgi:hypothetical protein
MMRKEKIRYCRDCGGLIDNKTKKCTACGRQFFKLNISKILLAVLTLTIIAGLSAYNAYQYNIITTKNNTISELITENQSLNSTISAKESHINSLIDTCNEYKNKYSNARDFIDKCAVVYEVDSEYYHSNTCLEAYRTRRKEDNWSYWIYNINAAKSKGYSPCPSCH